MQNGTFPAENKAVSHGFIFRKVRPSQAYEKTFKANNNEDNLKNCVNSVR